MKNNSLTIINGINLLVLCGSYHKMGVDYGRLLQNQLQEVSRIIHEYFVMKHNISQEQLLQQAQLLYCKYPLKFQEFIQGIAFGSDLSLDDCKILNAMETLYALIDPNLTLGNCAFVFIPPLKTVSGEALIGRNYDFPPPYDNCAQYLTVTILAPEGEIKIATIALAGQIYAPTGINAHGLFLELNNGMASGGSYVDHSKPSLLMAMMTILQSAKSLAEAKTQLSALDVDYSLIINAVDSSCAISYEFSSSLGLKQYVPDPRKVFVSTNFYLSKEWEGIAAPSDVSCYAVTRRNNLLNLLADQEHVGVEKLQAILDITMEQGGAVWDSSIYQVIWDPQSFMLYLKQTKNGRGWVEIDLSLLRCWLINLTGS